MKSTKNFETFFDESLRTEELPCVTGGVETDDNVQLPDDDTYGRICFGIQLFPEYSSGMVRKDTPCV
ncbi:MAG: hypothetical protein LBG28_09975 [Tannerella sp.]|jgi:hypothetical protein|nr:hypothetical protein [Tannerella sp.]